MKNQIKIYPLLFVCIIALIFSCGKEKEDDTSTPSIPSCVDGILNQDEIEIDCGGVCDACPTCDDGIQNQGELGIDCSGPCANVCDFIAPCDYLENLVLYDHFITTLTCDPSSNTIVGLAETGTLTITFNSYPTSSSTVNIGGGNSIVMEDELHSDTYVGISGKLYIEFTQSGMKLAFCSLTFNSSTIGQFNGDGKILCQ